MGAVSVIVAMNKTGTVGMAQSYALTPSAPWNCAVRARCSSKEEPSMRIVIVLAAAAVVLSLGPANPNIPTGEDADSACRGNFARGSRVDQYRDGAASLFCD
jgi:hypothetical protein